MHDHNSALHVSLTLESVNKTITTILADDLLSARMQELITQSAEDQVAILKAQWTADVAYLQLWGGYLGAMEVGWNEELCAGPD